MLFRSAAWLDGGEAPERVTVVRGLDAQLRMQDDAAQKLKNSTGIKDGAWLNNPGLFDNRFFNVSPREATQMDPVQRLCLTTTHEALEMAGYAPGASPSMDPERVATYIGVTGYDWLETLHQQGNDIYYVTGAAKAFVSGKINYHYKFGRGAYTLDSVCASSTTALTLACKGLIARDCDMAVAGGGSVFSAPFDFSGVGRSGMISLDGGCRTFHDDADGYARGEGIGMVILKRLEDAIADKDNILGVISGSSRMYSTTSTSITHPSHDSQEMATCLKMLQQSNAGTGFMHESFHKDDAAHFSRKWFAWANTLFGEFVLKVHREHPALLS